MYERFAIYQGTVYDLYCQKKTNSPKRDRSSSPMDMETASESEEDGQITKEQEQQEKFFGKANPAEDPITVDDLNKCRLSRNLIAEHCMSPWFEEYVQGMLSSARMKSWPLCEFLSRGLGTLSLWK